MSGDFYGCVSDALNAIDETLSLKATASVTIDEEITEGTVEKLRSAYESTKGVLQLQARLNNSLTSLRDAINRLVIVDHERSEAARAVRSSQPTT